jgi:hypothetical protein
MVTPELVSYIRSEKAKGFSRDILKPVLINAGWSSQDVDEAFALVEAPVVTPVVPPPVVPSIELLKENPVGSYSNSVQHHTLEKKTFLFAAIILLILIAGVAYSYYVNSIEKVLAEVSKNVEKAGSVSYDGTLTFKMNTQQSEVASRSSILGIDLSDVVIKMNGVLHQVGEKPEDQNFSADLSFKAGDAEFGLEYKVLEKILYVRPSKFPTLFPPEFSSYTNTWFYVDTKDVEELSRSTGLPGVPTEFPGGNEEKLKRIMEESSFIKITKQNGTESLGGRNTNRYLFELDRAGTLEFLKKYYELTVAEGQTFPFEYETIKKELEDFNGLQGEVWIGKDDKLPYKLNATTSFNLEEAEEKVGTLDINLELVLSNWNAPVNIEKPKDAVNFMTLATESLEDARSTASDAAVRAWLSSARVHAEIYWDANHSYKGFCKSNEALDTLKNVNNGMCKDTVVGYAMSAPIGGYQNYWCVDNTGYSGSLMTVPGGTSCN